MPSTPIAPDCASSCPLVVVYPDGSEESSFCERCEAYLEQTTRDLNAGRILDQQQ